MAPEAIRSPLIRLPIPCMGFMHLRAYQAAIILRAETDRIIAEMPAKKRAELVDVIKHLDESVNSLKNNIAEGNDSLYPAKRKFFFDVARGSALEARSNLNSLVERNAVSRNRAFRAIGLTIVIDKMLRTMIAVDPQS